MDNLTPTDRRIREAISKKMVEQSLSQAKLAARIRERTGRNVQQPNVYALISGDRGLIPQMLLDVMDALDLQLTVVSAESNEDEEAAAQAERRTA